MRSLTDITEEVKTVLLGVTDNVGKFEAIDSTKTFIVFGEDQESSRSSEDNKKEIQGIQGTIDLYAEKSDLSMADEIQEGLNNSGIAFYLNQITFENTQMKRFIHYEWVFEVS